MDKMLKKTNVVYMSTDTVRDSFDKSTKLFKFWNLEQKDKTAELMLYGDIIENSYWDNSVISALDVIKDLKNLDVENINIHINSNGGGVTSAVAIANTLKQHKAKITCYIDGIVASAATIITSACDVVKMPKNAIFMIHNPWTVSMGDSEEMRKMADTLDKIKNTIISTYIDKTGLEENVLSELMDNKTYMTAEEALEYGFVDEIIDNTDIESMENRVFSNGLVFNMSEGFKNFDTNKFKNKVSIQKDEINNKNKKEEVMTKEQLKEQFPDVYDSILTEGIKNERARIKEIESLGISGDLVEKAKFIEIKNANELAVELLKSGEFTLNATNKTVDNVEKLKNDNVKDIKDVIIENLKNSNKPLRVNVSTDVDTDIEFANRVLAQMKMNGGK